MYNNNKFNNNILLSLIFHWKIVCFSSRINTLLCIYILEELISLSSKLNKLVILIFRSLTCSMDIRRTLFKNEIVQYNFKDRNRLVGNQCLIVKYYRFCLVLTQTLKKNV